MNIHRTRTMLAAASGLLLAAVTAMPALAHAFLDHAVPGVGATVTAAPGDLSLSFTQNVVVALCRVSITRADGGAVAAGKPIGEGGNSSGTLHVRLSRALASGSYVVTWSVVSVVTHPTSGSYRFTVGS